MAPRNSTRTCTVEARLATGKPTTPYIIFGVCVARTCGCHTRQQGPLLHPTGSLFHISIPGKYFGGREFDVFGSVVWFGFGRKGKRKEWFDSGVV